MIKKLDPKGFVYQKLGVSAGGADTDAEAAPTITSGDAAPTSVEPDGSLYMRTGNDGELYLMIAGVWTLAAPTGQ